MKLTVIVEDAPEGWGQNAFKGYLELLNGADLVVVNGKVTKAHDRRAGQLVEVEIREVEATR